MWNSSGSCRSTGTELGAHVWKRIDQGGIDSLVSLNGPAKKKKEAERHDACDKISCFYFALLYFDFMAPIS